MNTFLKMLVAGAVLSISTPALAYPTYVANFKGTVTSGSYELVSSFLGVIAEQDLTGDLVDVSFTASYFDTYDDIGNPVVGLDVTSSVVDLTNPGYSNTFEAMTESQDFSKLQSATFAGNGNAGGVTADWRDLFFGTTYHFDLTYSGASSGPLTGSGRTTFDDYPNDPATSLGINFALTSGSVSVLGAPEPASWTLMIGGFGMVGAALRRRDAALRVSCA